ncbi:MAG TPA: hypothetical protein VK089_04785 [Corynebacterium sp.]|nr:hypothetical protein [Corynebacterium sp.]
MGSVSTPEPNSQSSDNSDRKDAERVGFDDILPFNLDPSYDPREGLWDPERDAHEDDVNNESAVPEPAPPVPVVKRKRALPRSWVNITLRAMFVLVILAALWGLIF